MVPQSWMIARLKKVSDSQKSHKFHHGSHVKVIAGRKTLTEVKIKRGIFRRNALS